jgi:type I restriction-modification system DNA methylase subunit
MGDQRRFQFRVLKTQESVDVFNKRLELPKYSRMVGFEEIEKNEFNLNLPRYIDSQQPESFTRFLRKMHLSRANLRTDYGSPGDAVSRSAISSVASKPWPNC